MADRRDFMGYIGTGAIGSIVGYYVGAQKLLGIQSEEVVEERNLDQSTEEPPEDTPTEDQSTEEPPEDTPTETETPTGAQIDTSMTAQQGLAYNEGSVYIVDDGSIKIFDRDSEQVTNSFDVPDGSRPRGLAFGDGSLWFADRIGPDYDGEVAELNPNTGEIQSTIESSWDPRGLAFGEGSLWVVDITANRIVEYSTNGNSLSSFDTGGVTWGLGLAYFDGSLWLGNNCANSGCTVSLREYSTDGELLQVTGKRTETGYGGLATTDSELLGPDTDGTLTILRTL